MNLINGNVGANKQISYQTPVGQTPPEKESGPKDQVQLHGTSQDNPTSLMSRLRHTMATTSHSGVSRERVIAELAGVAVLMAISGGLGILGGLVCACDLMNRSNNPTAHRILESMSWATPEGETSKPGATSPSVQTFTPPWEQKAAVTTDTPTQTLVKQASITPQPGGGPIVTAANPEWNVANHPLTAG